jgi:hypothetical protein
MWHAKDQLNQKSGKGAGVCCVEKAEKRTSLEETHQRDKAKEGLLSVFWV